MKIEIDLQVHRSRSATAQLFNMRCKKLRYTLFILTFVLCSSSSFAQLGIHAITQNQSKSFERFSTLSYGVTDNNKYGFIGFGDAKINVGTTHTNEVNFMKLERKLSITSKFQTVNDHILTYPKLVNAVSLTNTINVTDGYNLCLMSRRSGDLDRFAITQVKMTGPGLMNIAGGFEYGSGTVYNLLPIHSLAFEDQIYVCGYATEGSAMAYPIEADDMTPKFAFVARVDLLTNTGFVRYFNSSNPSGGRDYDIGMRLKMINGRLIVLGSMNDFTVINNSWAWAAELNQSTLATINESHFGHAVAYPGQLAAGMYAVDIVEDDVSVSGGFYCLSNVLGPNSFAITHLEPNLGISSANPNSVWSSVDNQNAVGLFNITPGAGRLAIYGESSPLITDVGTSPASQPYNLALDITYDATSGIGISGYSWHIHVNNTGLEPPIFYGHRYWTNSNMGRYQLSTYAAVTAAPTAGAPELGMFAHWMDNGSGYVMPRLIYGGEGGHTGGCPGSQNTVSGWPHMMSLNTSDNTFAPSTFSENLITVGLMPHEREIFSSTSSCNPGSIYRESAGWENVYAKEINIFPNPVSDVLNVENIDDNERLEIYDIMGKKVEYIHKTDGEIGRKIDVKSLPNGVYLIRGQKDFSQVIIKN